jgi:hypothetical protein
MSTIISDSGVTLPLVANSTSGQLFYQIGSGPKIFNGSAWITVPTTDIDFLLLLALKQGNDAVVSQFSSSLGSSGSAIDLSPLISALNADSANLVSSTNTIAGFVKALAVITEYWKQIGEVRVERYTKNVSTLPIDEPLVQDHPIVAAHNSAQTTIQS